MRIHCFASFAISALFACVPAFAFEPWADAKLPVQDGLIVWLDATRQAAAWSANQKELVTGDPLDVFYDASGQRRHFTQAVHDAQPKLISANDHAAIRFDGKDDHLRFAGGKSELKSFTAFIVAAPRTNAGYFRGFLAAAETGKNDYNTGFNIDLGPQGTPAFGPDEFLNVEGPGFIGAKSLIKEPIEFDAFQIFTVTCAPGPKGVSARINGKPPSTQPRDRAPGALRIDSLVLGARCFSNDSAPHAQGFLDGDIAEVLLFDRVLSDTEITGLTTYLQKKHEGANVALIRDNVAGKLLERVEDPPDVQMFLPGFSYKKLPLDLTNINNLRYREDGKLVALAYDGNVYLLSDTDNDGLEDKAELYWESKGKITSPIGIALTPPNYPHGRGLFVANKGKLSLLTDTDGDDKADKETVVAEGWPATFVTVDALGVAIAPDNTIFFGIGCTNFADAFLIDKATGKAKYDVKSERGTIIKVSPDLKHREIVCTGIRFPVGLAFNTAGDLFATEQEGATWLANGNPFDELLHIKPGLHYGFPPRHPTHLPNVIDEPSTFDYAPQHQSTCGLFFNEPVNGGPAFGPKEWRGDAIICGEVRGKLYRTKLVKTPAGYVAQTQLIGSIPMLVIDATVTPTGDLVVACHSGPPDWGTGPTGKGSLYKISYQQPEQPQPLFAYTGGASEVRVAFDRPLDPAALGDLAKKITIDFGPYVGAGDRFEKIRPGYAAVRRQIRAPRHELAVSGVRISQDHRELVLITAPRTQALAHAITLDQSDLAYDLTGVSATWQSTDGAKSASVWLPHADLAVARAFTAGSAAHDAFWPLLKTPGTLTLRTSLDLDHMLRPQVQPGSTLDYTLPPETVTVTFSSGKSLTVTPKENELVPVEIVLPTGSTDAALTVSFTTSEDSRPRPFQLRRFLLPWARLAATDNAEQITNNDLPQLKGGDWLRGRAIFFGNEAACAKCHTAAGRGSDLGPDLSNLIHRDYDSVLRDIRQPSATLNPDYLASTVTLKSGQVVQGIMRNVDKDHFLLRGDVTFEKSPLARDGTRKITPSPISLMPSGIAEGIGEEKTRDLMTFLLTQPLAPAAIERKGAPPPRPRGEVTSILKSTTPSSQKPLRVLLVSGPKDHGPSEHDYPAFQKRWATLLGLDEDVQVAQTQGWPTAQQWHAADVAVFYSANPGFSAETAKDLDAHFARGGGVVFIHMAVHGHAAPDELARRIGLAWGPGGRFRHGALELNLRDANHPITRGLSNLHFVDESYWSLTGDAKKIHVLADAVEDGQLRPLIWTVDHQPGRVFVSILGHYTWTFDDPLFRLMLLRGIAWSAGQDADRLSGLATIGARVQQ